MSNDEYRAEHLLKDMPPYMLTKEVCDFFRASRSTVLLWLREGKFDGAYKVGKDWRIPKQSVIDLSESFYGKDKAEEMTTRNKKEKDDGDS